MLYIRDVQRIWGNCTILQRFIIIGAIFTLAWLISLACYIRPASDDYCSFIDMQNIGIIKYPYYYYEHINGRLSSALLNVVVYSPQNIYMLILLGIVNILFYIISVYYFISSHFSLSNKILTLLVIIIVSLLTFSMFLDKYQLLFWAPGIISYTFPISSLFMFLGWCTKQSSSWKLYVVMVIAGILFGLTNELLAIFGIGLIFLYIILSKRITSHKADTTSLMVFVLAQVFAFGVIYFSPGSVTRRASSLSDNHLLTLVGDSMDSFLTILSNLVASWAFVGLVAAGLLVSMILRMLFISHRRTFLWCSGWLSSAGIAWIFIAVFISLYSYGTSPPGRMIMPGIVLFATAIPIGIAALMASNVLYDKLPNPIAKLMSIGSSIIVLISCIVFLFYFSGDVLERSMVWEEQNEILSLPGMDSREVFSSLPTYSFDGVGDIETSQENWIEACMRIYYD